MSLWVRSLQAAEFVFMAQRRLVSLTFLWFVNDSSDNDSGQFNDGRFGEEVVVVVHVINSEAVDTTASIAVALLTAASMSMDLAVPVAAVVFRCSFLGLASQWLAWVSGFTVLLSGGFQEMTDRWTQ